MGIGWLRYGPTTAVLFGLALLSASAKPAPAADFYQTTAADLNGPAGSLIRVEGMDIQLTDAHVYRIVYRSTGLDGKIIPVSGLVIVPFAKPPQGGWPVIAWAHPTTGIARKCAPTVLLPDPINVIPGINEMLSRRFVVVATDYPGLGTVGPHPYLVGVSEGRAVLDSVRAAREMREANAGGRVVVWGHSQGGHAALYAGELAAKYASDLELLGVAAAAPATDLVKLFDDDLGELSGRILGALVLDSWSKVFGAPVAPYIVPAEKPYIAEIGGECIDLPNGIVRDLLADKALPKKFLVKDPTGFDPWKSLAANNSPGKAAPGAPLFIAQGTGDTTVDPSVTVAFVKAQCAKGATVRFVEYKGVTHVEIAKASARDTLAWIIDRFEGKPAPSTCGG